jgi:hypothetical protein
MTNDKTIIRAIQSEELNLYTELKALGFKPFEKAIPVLNILIGVVSVTENSRLIKPGKAQKIRLALSRMFEKKQFWIQMESECIEAVKAGKDYERMGFRITETVKLAFEMGKLIFKIMAANKQLTNNEFKQIGTTFINIINQEVESNCIIK